MKKLISKILWFLLSLIWLVIGITWITSKEFEPIHEKITLKKWDEVPEEFQEVILFLMTICSGMCLGIGVLMLFMIFGPLKRVWCCTNVYLLILNVIALSPLTISNIILRFGRDPPIKEPNWILASLSLVLAIVGFITGFEKCEKCPCLGSCSTKCEKKEEKEE